jgi:hypothetical protein
MRTTFAPQLAINAKSAAERLTPEALHSSDGRSTPWKVWTVPSAAQTEPPLVKYPPGAVAGGTVAHPRRGGMGPLSAPPGSAAFGVGLPRHPQQANDAAPARSTGKTTRRMRAAEGC